MHNDSRTLCTIVIGDEQLTERCARMLVATGHTLSAVVTSRDELAVWARQHDIDVISSENPGLAELLGEYRCDYLFSVANLQILPNDVLAIANDAAINFHDGPLPRYAGVNATTWAVLNGETEHGITWHLMAPGPEADTGDILIQQTVPVDPADTAHSLNVKCAEAGMETFAQLLEQLATGTTEPVAQDINTRTYFGKWKRPRGLGLLNWTQAASDLAQQARALHMGSAATNRIGRSCLMIGRDVLLCHCAPAEETGSAGGAETDRVPGTVMAATDDALLVATIDGDLVISDLETTAGRPIPVKTAVERFNLEPGTVLPDPTFGNWDKLDQLAAEMARHEPFWVDQLSAVSPVNLPYPDTNVRHPADRSIPTVNVDSMFADSAEPQTVGAAAFALFLTRLTGESSFSLDLSYDILDVLIEGVEGFYADSVPWLIEATPTAPAIDALTESAASLSTTMAKGSYQRDLVARTPALRSTSVDDDADPSAVAYVRVHLGDRTPHWTETNPTITVMVRTDGSYHLRGSAAFGNESLERLAGQLRVFLTDITNDPVRPAAEAQLLDDAQQHQLLRQWNDTAVDYESTSIVELFRRQVATEPDRVAVAAGANELTYLELDQQSSRLAGHLRNGLPGGDVGLGSVVGLALPRSDELVTAVLAVLKTGAAYLPLDPEYPAERLAFMLDDSGAQTVITTAELAEHLPVDDSEIVLIDGHWVDTGTAELFDGPEGGIAPEELAYLIYTSGSTGRPKGVMVEHGNVVSFFIGMDERIPHQPGDVWLAVTSLSFDISVLELLWTLCRGLTVVVHGAQDGEAASVPKPAAASQTTDDSDTVDFSLFYFSADQGSDQPYRLLMEGARYADANGFAAVWTPERHFHEFGGLYPNPAVTGAALAATTENIDIRAGSVVAPLHSPIRIAEDWSIIDNLSNGRTGVAFASGWMPEDFVIRPDDYVDKKQATFTHLDTVRRLWRGESVTMPTPDGKTVDVTTLPRPVQNELPCWITTAGNPQTFEMAGTVGANVLTHMLGQSIDELAERIDLYRKAWADAGHSGAGRVTVMLHTLVGQDHDETLDAARPSMRGYLASSTNLLRNYASSFPTFRRSSDAGFDDLADDQLDALLDYAVTRHLETSGLFGTPDSCQERVDQMVAIGVDEIACLIDFGVDPERALAGLEHLNQLRANQQSPDRRTSNQTSSKGAQPIADLVERHRVTHLQCTPSMARMLLADDNERTALAKLQAMMVGGEASSTALVDRLTSVVPGPVLNMYGPTETTIWSLTHHLEGGGDAVPIGRPIANTRIYVVNEQLRPQPVGVPGELLIGGPGVTRGYHERTDLTKDRFITSPFGDPAAPRLYRTGDLVRYRDDGAVEFLGRLDHQVKIRGHRIELGEIEAALNRHRSVAEAVVVARQDRGQDKRLVAYVTATPDSSPGDLSEDELKRQVAGTLPAYMVPTRAVVLDNFPQTPNGKIDRKCLPEPSAINRGDLSEQSLPPQGPIEEAVAALWAEILDRSAVGRNDEFFQIGGDSLSLIETTSAVTDRFGVNISVAEFLADPTVSGLAAQVSAQAPAQTTGPGAVADIVHPSGVTTRRMTQDDIASVIPLHLRYFPSWRVSKLGPRFLHRMYRWYIETHPDLAIVATGRNDRVIGFTVGTVGPYKRALFAAAFSQLLVGLARNPRAVLRGEDNHHEDGRELEPADSIRADDPSLANNRIMALEDIDGGGGYELLVAFERAAQGLGTEPFFHTGNVD